MEHKHSTQKINLTAAKSAQKNYKWECELSLVIFSSCVLFVNVVCNQKLFPSTSRAYGSGDKCRKIFFFFVLFFIVELPCKIQSKYKKKLAYLPLLYVFLQSKDQKIWIKKSIPIGTCMLKKWKFCILLGYVCSLFPCNVFMNRICWKNFVVQLTAFFALI